MAQEEVQNGADKGNGTPEVSFVSFKPQLVVEALKVSEAVQFYKAAFGALETGRTTDSKRKADQELPHIISAQLSLAGSTFIVSDVSDDTSTAKSVGTGLTLLLETEDVEAAVTKAVAAGAVAEGEVTEGGEDACCGGRVAKLKDPYGFLWTISSPASKPVIADVEA